MPPLNYEYVTRHERLGHIANEIACADVIALDLETTPKKEFKNREGAAFSPHFGESRLCSINTGRAVYVVDLRQTQGLGPIREALHNPEAVTGPGRPVVVGQNIKFDQRYLFHEWGLELWPIFDTYRASALLHNGKMGWGHNLWDILYRELRHRPTVEDLGASDWGADVLTPEQLDYSADDVAWLPILRDKLRPQLMDAGLGATALIEFGAILPEAVVELNGFRLDPAKWLKLAAETKAKRDELARVLLRDLPNPKGQMFLPGASDWMFGPDVLEQWAGELAGEEIDPDMLHAHLKRRAKPKGSKDKTVFNLGSSDQLRASIRRIHKDFEKLENTSEAILATYAAKYPIIKTLIDYRGYATRYKSFGPDFLDNINPTTGRIHTSYFPLLVTGRYAHLKPNLGQIPRDKAYRACFEEEEGIVLTIADYSNIEMYLMAEISRDRRMVKIFREGKDAHRYTAAKVAGIPEDQVTKLQRQAAKPGNFGFIYGMQPEKFVSYALTGYGQVFTMKEATAFRDSFFAEFSDLAEWHIETLARGERTRQSRSIVGRRRYLNEQAHNEYLNNPVQSSGADGLKSALREVYFRFKRKFGTDVKMCHHVHDEIVARHAKNEELAHEVRHELETGMKVAMQRFLRLVPVRVEAATGVNWADKA